ncbi:MAG TPA: tetratricopeptide repeat protein [Opitutales bacterium]|nr:tetratricopeptide repeat protein [Opitutales bacterium]
MKTLFLILMFVPLAAFGRENADALFSKGNTAYIAGQNAGDPADAKTHYAEAADSYRAAIEANGGSWAGYYNLGNALYRLGDFGGAALAFEKAVATDPLRPEAFANLAELRKSAGLPPERTRGAIERLGMRVPFRYLMWTAAAAGWVFLSFLVLPFLHGGHRIGSIAGAAVSLALFAAAATGLFGWHIHARWQIVTNPDAQLLAAPDARASVVGKLAPATGVEVLRRSGDWLFVKSETGAEGWTGAADSQSAWKR